jgi:hypothetical protein
LLKIEVKDGDKVISTREVELKQLNLTERCRYNDLMFEHNRDPEKNLFSRVVEVCKIWTNYTDEELNEFSDAEFFQLFGVIILESRKKK